MPLEGETVILREERESDIELLLALRNDMATQGWNMALPPDYTTAMETKRVASREYSMERDDGRFIVTLRDTGEAVGYIRYSWLTPRWDATMGISMLRRAWGTGAAFDAQETLLRFVFLDLGVRVARLWTHGGNDRAMALAERSGFVPSLRIRAAIYKGGRLVDTVQMDLLREEYFERHPELVDELPGLSTPTGGSDP